MGDSCDPVDSSSEGVSNDNAQESGNKRKFVSEASQDSRGGLSMQAQDSRGGLSMLAQDSRGGLSMQALFADLPDYETVEELEAALNESDSLRESSDAIEEPEEEELLKADWDDFLVCQLQELLINNLLAVFNDAIKKIVESGYTAEVAEWAILNSGLFHGSKDAVSNVVDGALALLKGEKDINPSFKYSVFKEMRYLAAYTLLEMIHVLQEIRPTFTLAEAMFSLLISDLNLLNACVVDKPDSTEDSPKPSKPNIETPGTVPSESKNGKGSQNESSDSGQTRQQANLKGRAEELTGAIKETCVSFQHGKGKFSGHVQISSQTAVLDEKLGGFKKGSAGSSKRDTLRQKAFQMEKNCKGRISKSTFKAKVAAWGSMVIDKSQKSVSVSSSMVMTGSASVAECLSEPKSGVPASVSRDKDPASAMRSNCSASSASKQNPSPKEESTASNPTKVIDYTLAVPPDETNETVLILVSHKKALDKEMQDWNKWAMEKIGQTTKRLSKDKPELRMLRQEKEECEKVEKDRQSLEETTMKRLAEMEFALSNANGQIEVANSTLRRLEEENMLLKVEMKEDELAAMRSQRKCEEAYAKEVEAEKKAHAVDKEKGLMMDKFRTLKQHAVKLHKQAGKGTERLDQFMVLFKHEEKDKLKTLAQVDALRAKKEEDRELHKVEAGNIQQAADVELQKCKENIQELEKGISEQRLETNRKKIAALNIGYAGSSLTGSGTSLPKVTKRLAAFQHNFGGENVNPERECVMCLTEEESMLFLPCAHKVLCEECSIIHEKQGMNDCPSCRQPIERRIRVYLRKRN